MRHLPSFLVCLFILFVPVAESRVTTREFDQAELRDLREDPAFDYSQAYASSGSLISLFLAYLLNKFLQWFDFSGVGWIMPWVFRLMIAVLILFLIYVILKNKYGPLFILESQVHVPTGMVSEVEENVDFDKLILQFTANSEYKMAIRYLFLKSLNALHARGELQIRQWKAPYDYLDELPENKRPFFHELTDLFELTWYGGYQADESIFNRGLAASNSLTG